MQTPETAQQHWVLQPIVSDDADRLRVQGGTLVVAEESPGFPCRVCLRDADVGESMLLTQYDPFDGNADSPYRSASPVYVHAAGCAPWRSDGELPISLTRRTLSVRAFNANMTMIDAAVIDGTELEATAEALLTNRAIDRLHVHNAAPGCWAVTIVEHRSSRHTGRVAGDERHS